MLDAFRKFHPEREKAFTCWNTKLGCRKTNYGTRLDYVLVNRRLVDEDLLSGCDIHPDVEGSDHCPVSADFEINFEAQGKRKFPAVCTKFYPEFAGKQKKLLDFFSTAEKRTSVNRSGEEPATKKQKTVQAKMSNFFAPKEKRAENIPLAEIEVKIDEAAFKKREAAATAWKGLFKGPKEAPLCKGHRDKSVLRTVKKKGPNCGRQFWSCPRGEGRADDPEARCDFFMWYNKEKR